MAAEQSTVWLACKEDEDKFERGSSWAECPTDLLTLILERISIKDRPSFNSVCKSWNAIMSPLPPCLMLLHGNKETWKLFYALYNESYYVTFPELLGAEIYYSKYGWLLMSQCEKNHFFFNPCTKVRIELPSTQASCLQMCFTSPPISANNCIIFGIFYSSFSSNWKFGYIKLGEHEWTVYKYFDSYLSWPTYCSPVFCNGLFYCLSYGGNMGVFNPDDKKCWQWVQCHKRSFMKKDVFHQDYLAEVDGEIWGVFFMHKDVHVCKLNLKSLAWDPLQSLGNKCLYVSPRVSYAETCVDKTLANKIYFNMFDGENGIFYCLASKMYKSVVGGFANKEARWLIKRRDAIWFRSARNESES